MYKETCDSMYIGILFERYSHLAYGVCLKYLKNEEASRDAVLNIFEDLIHDLFKFNVKNFPPWLHSVAKNHCLMILRKKRLEFNDEYGITQAESTLAITPENMLFIKEDLTETHLEFLDEAMEMLNDQQQLCIRKFFLEDKSYKQISELTGFDLNLVKSHIQNGKRNLKNYLLKKSANAK
ncbi:MAG: sigma-70 family RNA polymerase sigma factor [Bacteroidia bacterium]|nr:sigma-70 family RNA polymerase sigma factor [Bacteroidia bacterium]